MARLLRPALLMLAFALAVSVTMPATPAEAAGAKSAKAKRKAAKSCKAKVRRAKGRAAKKRAKTKCRRAARRRRAHRRASSTRPVAASDLMAVTAAKGGGKGPGKPTAPVPEPEPPAPEPTPTPTPEPTPGPAPTPALPYFGFNDNSVRYGQMSATQNAAVNAEAGANVARVMIDWRWLERYDDFFHWTDYDAIAAALKAKGIKPLWVLGFAPSWAIDPATPCDQNTADCRYPPSAAHLDDWRQAVAAVATRYPESAGIEIWNEPNSNRFWMPGPDPKAYVGLVREARAGLDWLRSVGWAGANVPLMAGSFNDLTTDRDGSLSLTTFARAFYANGGLAYADKISLHAYPWSLSTGQGSQLRRTLDTMTALRAEAGDTKPLWITESGLTTTGWDSRYTFTGEEQAQGLLSVYDAIAAEPGVEGLTIHSLVEPPVPDWSPERGYGVIAADGVTRKPAFGALAAARSAN